MQAFGLEDRWIKEIRVILQSYPEIKTAKIYGSRAKAEHKIASDIDIVIYGDDINYKTCLKLKDKLEEETSIPYFFDITHYESISNDALKEHIDTYALEI